MKMVNKQFSKMLRFRNECACMTMLHDFLVMVNEKLHNDEEVSARFLNDFSKISSNAFRDAQLLLRERDIISDISELLEQKVRFGIDKKDDPMSIFAVGYMAAIIKLCVLCLESEAERDSIASEVECINSTDGAKLKAIYSVISERKSGITHQDLADSLGWSKSYLSQYMNRSNVKEYFYSQKIGREKYYYISYKGRRLFKYYIETDVNYVTNTSIEIQSNKIHDTKVIVEKYFKQYFCNIDERQYRNMEFACDK